LLASAAAAAVVIVVVLAVTSGVDETFTQHSLKLIKHSTDTHTHAQMDTTENNTTLTSGL